MLLHLPKGAFCTDAESGGCTDVESNDGESDGCRHLIEEDGDWWCGIGFESVYGKRGELSSRDGVWRPLECIASTIKKGK